MYNPNFKFNENFEDKVMKEIYSYENSIYNKTYLNIFKNIAITLVIFLSASYFLTKNIESSDTTNIDDLLIENKILAYYE